MGMTIEELVAENDRLNRQLAYETTALTMMKADYENRLKADIVAMLEEVKDKMLHDHFFDTSLSKDFQHGMDCARREDLMVIQEEIDSLKEG